MNTIAGSNLVNDPVNLVGSSMADTPSSTPSSFPRDIVWQQTTYDLGSPSLGAGPHIALVPLIPLLYQCYCFTLQYDLPLFIHLMDSYVHHPPSNDQTDLLLPLPWRAESLY